MRAERTHVLLGAAVMVAVLVLADAGCSNDWRTDMWYQPAHRPAQDPRVAPAHSVPFGVSAPPADRAAADSLRNPQPADSASLRHGRFLFEQRCACCHGPEGRGGGPVSKFFPPAPDLSYSTVRARSDGYIFGTVLFGGKAMPAQAEGLTDTDRWDLVNLVRHLQGVAPGGGR